MRRWFAKKFSNFGLFPVVKRGMDGVMQETKKEILAGLRRELLRMQAKRGVVPVGRGPGLGPLLDAFPEGLFPQGVVHEFQYGDREGGAATKGFLAALLGGLYGAVGTIIWISRSGTVFPPALAGFGLAAERVLFVQVGREGDVLWTLEEALKSEGVSAVVAEAPELSFIASRRLQLAVEKSMVTGFVLLPRLRAVPTACVARWEISPLGSLVEEGLPGIGFPRWRVRLSKVRSGRPGTWELAWVGGAFRTGVEAVSEGKLQPTIAKRKTG